MGGFPTVDAIEQQKKNITEHMHKQGQMQVDRLDAMKKHQLAMLETEHKQKLTVFQQQANMQFEQAKQALEMSYTQQLNQLNQQKQSQDMAVNQQALTLQSQAKQVELQREMQKAMYANFTTK